MGDSLSDETLEQTLKQALDQAVGRLRETVDRALRVPYYRDSFARAGIESAEDIRSIADFQRVPFTQKEDLRLNYPFGLFAEPLDNIVRLQASSGTTGKMTVVGYTANDIELWATAMADALRRGGVTPQDIVQVGYGYGLFTGGLGYHYGCEKLGALTIPLSSGNTERHIMFLRDMKSTVLACTSSYALHIADTAAEMGLGPEDFCLRMGVFGAEPWTEAMRTMITQRLGLKSALDMYGLSEIIGPGVAMECAHINGLHMAPYFYPEIVDTWGRIMPPGTQGELVLSSMGKEAFPSVRYRTKDLTTLSYGRCACGFCGWSISRIAGRVDDMLIIRGVNVFPSQIEEAILSVEGIEPHYLIVVDRRGALDYLEVQVEVSGEAVDGISRLEELQQTLQQRIFRILGLAARVRLVEPLSLPRSEGKAVRVRDMRVFDS
ncbi:MAG: phenylacetate--CoA ligase [Peptococcaceae bacterium]|nr:phenylacetate--CoA ligase [Peptococcaceae bacterium]